MIKIVRISKIQQKIKISFDSAKKLFLFLKL